MREWAGTDTRIASSGCPYRLIPLRFTRPYYSNSSHILKIKIRPMCRLPHLRRANRRVQVDRHDSYAMTVPKRKWVDAAAYCELMNEQLSV